MPRSVVSCVKRIRLDWLSVYEAKVLIICEVIRPDEAASIDRDKELGSGGKEISVMHLIR